MGRKIYITSEMSVDERIIEVAERNPQAALLWPWILTAFDDWGRANADPKRLKASVFPAIETVTPDLIASALELYAEAGLVVLYEHQGKSFMAIPPEKWFKYQTHIRGEKRAKDNSKFPAPPSEVREGSVQVRADARDVAQASESARNCTPSPSPSPSPTEVLSTSTVELVGGTKIVPHVGGAENGNGPADEGEPEASSESAREQKGRCAPDLEQEVMDCYNEVFAGLWARPLRLTPERRAKIRARLKSYSVEEICQAIRNIRASPYHCGENEGGKVYATPEFICRNDSTVDKWLKFVPVKRTGAAENRFGGKAPPEVKTLVNGSISAFFARKEAMASGSGGSG